MNHDPHRESDPLRALLSGKRAHPRLLLRLPVLARCKRGEYEGSTVDISEGGVLMRMDRAALMKAIKGEVGNLIEWMHEEFDGGFDLVFPSHGVVVETTMLRLGTRSGEEDGLFLGCSFANPLTPEQQRRLGMTNEVSIERAPTRLHDVLEGLSLLTRPGVYLQVLLFTDDGGTTAGPRYIGHVRGLGERMFAADLPARSDGDVHARLGDHPLTMRFVHGGQTIWSVRAQLVAAEFKDRDGGMVAVGLLSEKNPPRFLRKRYFERRRRA